MKTKPNKYFTIDEKGLIHKNKFTLEENDIINKLKNLEYEIQCFWDGMIRLSPNDDIGYIFIYPDDKTYSTDGQISMKIHLLLHKLFELWGWFDD